MHRECASRKGSMITNSNITPAVGKLIDNRSILSSLELRQVSQFQDAVSSLNPSFYIHSRL